MGVIRSEKDRVFKPFYKVRSRPGALMFHEVQLLLSSLQVAELMELKEDEESIAILLVGFGVLLEGRHILQNWVAGEEVESSETTHKCEYYGFDISR